MAISSADLNISIPVDGSLSSENTQTPKPENNSVATAQVRSSDGQNFEVKASVREKTEVPAHNALAARVDTTSDSRESQSIFARIKALFTGGSRASQADQTPAEPGPAKKLATRIIETFKQNHPELDTSAKNIQERAQKHTLPAAEETVGKLKELDIRFDKDVFEIVANNGIKQAKERLDKVIQDSPDDIKAISKASKALNKDIQKSVVAAFELAASTADAAPSKSDIKLIKSEFQKDMKALVADSLNRTPENWKVVQETVKLDVATQIEVGADESLDLHDIEFNSERVPAANLKVLKDSYAKDGLSGVSSMSTSEAGHAVNLNVSKHKGEFTSYAGVLHGVNFPFGIKNDPEAAKAGADKRTEETITATASTQAKQIEQWIIDHPDKPYPLKIVSTSLLTAASKAKTYEKGQQDAWGRAQGQQTIKVDLPNHGVKEVVVDVDVLPFSLGVNGFAKLGIFSGSIGKHIGNFLTGWKWADNHNRALFGKLDQMADQAQKQALESGDKGKADRIESYREQLNSALEDGKQRRSAGNAYGVAVLVQLIANEAGAGEAINCMSGKDRTGYLDAQIKARLEEVECLNAGRAENDRGLTPQIYGPRTEAQKALLSVTTEVMGGKSTQRGCTGVSGYKVGEGGVFKVQSNLDNVLDSKSLLGLSGAVKA